MEYIFNRTVFHCIPHLQSGANKHCIFKSDSCLACSVEKLASLMSLLLVRLVSMKDKTRGMTFFTT